MTALATAPAGASAEADGAAVVARGLRKRFGRTEALCGVDLRVEWGSVCALLGPNGAGKTTAIRILTTLLRPDGGSARVAGFDVVRDATEVRYRIGLAGQYAAVDANLTGGENLRLIGRLAQLPRRAVAPRAAELLERFQLQDAADRPVRTYSGGMRRRLDVAAALVQRPPVLFLDEPTTGLDLPSRNDLWATIRELVADGTSVLLTTQYLEEADRLADRVAVVDHGVVIAEGTPGELKARMGSTVIELGMADEAVALRALEVVAGIVADHPERDGPTLRLSSDAAPGVLVEVLRALDGAGLAPLTLSVRPPSLDDVFLALTGRRAEPAEIADGGAPAAETAKR